MSDPSIRRIKPQELDTVKMPTLDVRTHGKHHQVRGALQYSLKALLTEERLTLPFPHDATIVVYGDNEDTAERVAARLKSQGYKNAAVLEGGFQAYEALGLPTEDITQEQPVPGSESGIPRV